MYSLPSISAGSLFLPLPLAFLSNAFFTSFAMIADTCFLLKVLLLLHFACLCCFAGFFEAEVLAHHSRSSVFCSSLSLRYSLGVWYHRCTALLPMLTLEAEEISPTSPTSTNEICAAVCLEPAAALFLATRSYGRMCAAATSKLFRIPSALSSVWMLPLQPVDWHLDTQCLPVDNQPKYVHSVVGIGWRIVASRRMHSDVGQ